MAKNCKMFRNIICSFTVQGVGVQVRFLNMVIRKRKNIGVYTIVLTKWHF